MNWLLWKLGVKGLWLDQDPGSAGDPPEDGAEDESKKQEDKSKVGNPPANPEDEKKFSQAELNAIVEDRLKRERKKADDAAEAARKKAEQETLEKNQEWKTLAETRAAELETVTKERNELKAVQETADKYKTALEAQLEGMKKSLPKFVLPLLSTMDPVDALKYIAENSEELGAPKFSAFEETPNPKEKKLSDKDKQAAERAAAGLIERNF